MRICSVPKCGRKHSSHGYCKAHANHMRKKGFTTPIHTPLAPLPLGGKRVDWRGRIQIKLPNHPLADGNGYVAENRLRLYEAGVDVTGTRVSKTAPVILSGRSRRICVCQVCSKKFVIKASIAYGRKCCNIKCAGIFNAKISVELVRRIRAMRDSGIRPRDIQLQLAIKRSTYTSATRNWKHVA